MATYDRIANIQVFLKTARISGTNFGMPMIIGETSAFSERVIEITDTAELVSKGVAATDPIYVMANTALSQKSYGGINSLMVGRKSKDESYTDALNACRSQNATFRTVLCPSRENGVQSEIASWAESHNILYVTATADQQATDATSTTDILYVLSKYTHTACGYDPLAASQYIDAALAGRCLSQAIRAPWANRRIAGVTPLTDQTAAKAAIAKGAFTIESFSNGAGTTSITISQGGTVASGEWIDVIRGRDYAQEYLQLEMAQLHIDADIPYNDAGILIHVNRLSAGLTYLQGIGIIDDDVVLDDGTVSPGFAIKYPRRADISSNQVASRKLTDLSAEARLRGAIIMVDASVTLSYSTDIRGES